MWILAYGTRQQQTQVENSHPATMRTELRSREV